MITILCSQSSTKIINTHLWIKKTRDVSFWPRTSADLTKGSKRITRESYRFQYSSKAYAWKYDLCKNDICANIVCKLLLWSGLNGVVRRVLVGTEGNGCGTSSAGAFIGKGPFLSKTISFLGGFLRWLQTHTPSDSARLSLLQYPGKPFRNCPSNRHYIWLIQLSFWFHKQKIRQLKKKLKCS